MLEKDRDTLTDKINNGIIIMEKRVESALYLMCNHL